MLNLLHLNHQNHHLTQCLTPFHQMEQCNKAATAMQGVFRVMQARVLRHRLAERKRWRQMEVKRELAFVMSYSAAATLSHTYTHTQLPYRALEPSSFASLGLCSSPWDLVLPQFRYALVRS